MHTCSKFDMVLSVSVFSMVAASSASFYIKTHNIHEVLRESWSKYYIQLMMSFW